MFSTGAIIIVFISALLIGVGIGILLSRFSKSILGNTSSLKEKLAEKEQQLSDYQAEVTEHFLETSRRVNSLTKNYKEVHEYLAEGAAKLANPELARGGFSAQITLADKTSIADDQIKTIEQEEQEFTQEIINGENDSGHDAGDNNEQSTPKKYEPI
ncbi:MAG: YhcB family protein [Cellvibrionaceae bacterium]